MSTFAIGDIHGGLKALQQVLERASVTTSDKLIFLGDFVDGWSESAGVIEYCMELAKTHECIFIKGNHDEWCEDWLRTGAADKTWLFHGGQSTAKSYASLDADSRQQHLQFFAALQLYAIDHLNRLFVHAGFTSMHGPTHERHLSNFSWDRTLWETALAVDKKVNSHSLHFPKRLKLFHEIYIGHTPTVYYDQFIPMHGANVWNLDTGAAFTGSLTIMDIDTKQYWQSDPVMTLYPNESGRNGD